jgi:exonuclease III
VNLKFCLLNAENLFLLFDQPPQSSFLKMEERQWAKLSTSVYPNKDLRKTTELARTLNSIDADIVMLAEVGGLESLKNFNRMFLNSKYSEILVEGNSDRNIDVGFLIKKPAEFYFDLLSHKNRDLKFLYPHEKLSLDTTYPPTAVVHRFSRDCAELRLFKSDINHPMMIILLTHLKSPLDPERIDPHGSERRSAELKACVEIYNELRVEFPECPIMLCGDFNGNASRNDTDKEFAPIYLETDLEDVLELAKVDLEKRYTYLQIRQSQKTDRRQIDYCFLSKKLHPLVVARSAEVFLYKDEFGSDLLRPTTLEQKLSLPSDHYPIVFTLENL